MSRLDNEIMQHAVAYPPEVAAAITGRTRTRIFGAIKSGELQARKDGKATIIERDELIRWVKSFPLVVPGKGTAAAQKVVAMRRSARGLS